jgi:putative membrane protein
MSDFNQNDDLSKPKTPFQYLRLYFSGFAMGSADIVPGVSGGTMAFILGIYENLINAIKSFNLDAIRKALKLDVQGFAEHTSLRFLIALGLGLISAVLLLSTILHTLLEEQPTFLFSFFAGLIIASIIAIGVKVKWTPRAIGVFVLATVFAFVIVGVDRAPETRVAALIEAVEAGEGVEAAQTELVAALEAEAFPDAEAQVAGLVAGVEADEDVEELADEMETAIYERTNLLTLFVSGMIAICAMILPGISGSFILLILGQYSTVLGAVRNFDIVSIGAVGAGAALGIIIFSRILSWLLKHYENVTIAGLVGFMLGSLRLIWIEAAAGMDVVNDGGSLSAAQWALVAALILGGFLLVSLLDHLQSRTNPVFVRFWSAPSPPAHPDVIGEKADALE